MVADSELHYTPYGTLREGTAEAAPTARRYTGQRLEADLGLYDYGARYYHPALGRFISADTLVPSPGDPQNLNRYSYVRNNPLKYTDPSGHFTRDEIVEYSGAADWEEALSFFEEGGKWEGRWGWLAVLNRALLGDSVEALSGMPSFWGSRPEVLFKGQFVEQAGQLYLSPPNGRLVPFGFAGSLGETYLTIGNNPRGWGTGYINAYEYHYKGADLGNIDWGGMALDGLGLLADASTGWGGRVVNLLQASYKGVDIMKTLDVITAGGGIIQSVKDGRLPVDTALNVVGVFQPIWPDAISLIHNVNQAWYEIPIQEVVYGEEHAPRIKGW